MIISRQLRFAVLGVTAIFALLGTASCEAASDGAIRPYSNNSWYWEYQGKPVVLLGGSEDSAIFQWTGKRLTGFLDELAAVGGNYLRNIMSERTEGAVYAFKEVRDGVYDLDQWNEEYWNRLRFMLDETAKRGIVVQLTLWDYRDLRGWDKYPWNPANNINLDPNDLIRSFGDGFPYYTIRRNNEKVLRYQRQFIDKLLSITLDYGHVLYSVMFDAHYCPAWEDYWARYVTEAARAKGKTAYVTLAKHDPETAIRQTLSNPDIYSFIDISGNNLDSRGGRGQAHWDNIMFWRQKLASRSAGPMPMNNEQVAGAGDGSNYSAGTAIEATNRFWRNIFAGCASNSFRESDGERMWGLGFNKQAQHNIKAMRMFLKEVDIFSCVPHNDLLVHRVPVTSGVEAYVAANIGKQYAIFFPPGRYGVNLDPWIFVREMRLRWFDIDNLTWSEPEIVTVNWRDNHHHWGYRISVRLTTPSQRPYVALLEVLE